MKTHSFNGRKYKVELCEKLYGWCATKGELSENRIEIVDGDTLSALDTAIHEAMHACRIPVKYIDDNKVGFDRLNSKTMDIARFLWRLGWRKNGNR
jgi:hypothetical protein